MNQKFDENLAAMGNSRVQVIVIDEPFEIGEAPVAIMFENGTKLRATYWRLIKRDRAVMSSFDHRQKYGLPAPIDARTSLKTELENIRCTAVQLDKVTGDFILDFADDLNLQIFNFAGYEIWEITFPDGTGEYSNYVQGR
jgi:hypothetical protein